MPFNRAELADMARYDANIDHLRHPLYMAVTQDKYELPICVADSPYELAEKLGINVTNILHCTRRRVLRRSKYRKVWTT